MGNDPIILNLASPVVNPGPSLSATFTSSFQDIVDRQTDIVVGLYNSVYPMLLQELASTNKLQTEMHSVHFVAKNRNVPCYSWRSICKTLPPPGINHCLTCPLYFFKTQFKTQYAKRVVQVTMTVNDSIFTLNDSRVLTREEMIPVPGSVNGVNALGLVVFSICFGLIIGSMREQGQPLKDFFDCLNEAIMRLVAIIMW